MPATSRGTRSARPRSLARYRAKRRFDRTAEPRGDRPVAATGDRFVVQKHAARRLHYDFRLELDGVLLSWAVPRGPSLVPGARRLAVRTEDHPLDYADFEGIIPAGEYGGGTVAVWDRGRWTPEGDPRDGLRRGRLTFTLDGTKLRGRWHLVRTKLAAGRGGDGDGGESWLLFKGKDDAADPTADVVSERPESVLTGRTIEEIAGDADRVWHSDRGAAGPAARRPAAGRTAGGGDLPALVRSLPLPFTLTNLDKVLYPELGLTKAALIGYLAVVSDWMLPHVGGRPLTLVRCPDGHDQACWFQKHYGQGIPSVVDRIDIPEGHEVGVYMTIDDRDGLLALGQAGALEIHTWGSRADRVDRPDLLVFDLDPDVGLPWARVVAAALELRDRLGALGLRSFVKTTGGKGLHVVAPVGRRHDWDEHKAFAHAVAQHMAADARDRYTVNMSKARRTGRVFIDYLRNGRGATFIAPYSPRRRPGAPVATPIGWDELPTVVPAELSMTTVPARLGALAADPWAELFTARQAITAAAWKQVGGRPR